MTEEANDANRVVTIVQSSIPLAAATALDGVHTVHTEELPYGLGVSCLQLTVLVISDIGQN